MSGSVPVKLLHEGQGHNVTIELKNGELYRGHLAVAEDSMNCHLSGVTMRHKDGRTSKLENVFLRGSQIRFVVVPDLYPAARLGRRPDRAPPPPKLGPHPSRSLSLARPTLKNAPMFKKVQQLAESANAGSSKGSCAPRGRAAPPRVHLIPHCPLPPARKK